MEQSNDEAKYLYFHKYHVFFFKSRVCRSENFFVEQSFTIFCLIRSVNFSRYELDYQAPQLSPATNLRG